MHDDDTSTQAPAASDSGSTALPTPPARVGPNRKQRRRAEAQRRKEAGKQRARQNERQH